MSSKNDTQGEPEQNDRSLHFVVRHDGYKQTMGYRHFLNGILQEMNKQEYPNISELLIDTSERMRLAHSDPLYNGRDYEKLFECHTGNLYEPFVRGQIEAFNRILGIAHLAVSVLGKIPEEFLTGKSDDADTNKILDRLAEKEEELEKSAKIVFGPAAHHDYGLCFAGLTNYTPIKLTEETRSVRAYWHAVQKNLGLGDTVPDDFKKVFEYEIPESGGKKMQLMRIASVETLGEEMAGDKKFKETNLYKTMVADGKAQDLGYLHPTLTHEFLGDMVNALQISYADLIKKPQQAPAKGEAPPEHKLDDLATLYWLLAQSTPVSRGGSGMANLALEHLSFVLQKQGYEFEIPFTKDNVDLWAEATTLPLEDEGCLKGFRTRFKESLRNPEKSEFFDHSKTPEQVEDYLMDKLHDSRSVGINAAQASSRREANPDSVISH